MSVKWSPIAVNDKLDAVDAELDGILAPIEAAKGRARDALALPHLPEYMKQALTSVDLELGCTVSRLQWKLRSARQHLPAEVLAKEQHRRDLEKRLKES